MSTVRENLIAARALIDTPEKWGKGSYEPSHGCYCALGAIDAVEKTHGGFYASEATANALRSAIGNECFSIVDFNDAEETTHADILALFDRAIEATS